MDQPEQSIDLQNAPAALIERGAAARGAGEPGEPAVHGLSDCRQREEAERIARRALRLQIARLERELSDAVASAFPHVALACEDVAGDTGPRLLGLGELERLRDRLARRLQQARGAVAARAEAQERNRVLLERMFLEPGRYKFMRVAAVDVGEGGCGVYQVRPRLGVIGMLAGWWQVKLSSGCPLAGGPRRRRGPGSLHRRENGAPSRVERAGARLHHVPGQARAVGGRAAGLAVGRVAGAGRDRGRWARPRSAGHRLLTAGRFEAAA